ncbi:hypothetical protein [Brevundimonas sp.]|uniref:hypothetical protein n=1 Tax=Brevundimonas sp. TaxID=1871086 RepID=UPI00286CB815|nr:hypothetical protein [Brevundimonas sp.]
MIPTLIVLGFLAFGVAIVAFATRHRGPGAAPAPLDPQTGWNDPITPANVSTSEDPFAHAPQMAVVDPVRTTEPHA